MRVVIDYRETQLHTSCISLQIRDKIYKDIQIETANLPLGDIIIYDDSNKEILIIERKTLADFASSIQDSRYKEQSFRLNQVELHKHNIIYLIEGDLTRFYPKKIAKQTRLIDKKCLLSAMTSLFYEKGFSIYKTNDVDESAMYILHTAYKIQKSNYKGYYNVNNLNHINHNNVITHDSSNNILKDNNDNYTSVIKRVKKNNITPENIFSIMLSQIPNVSTNISNVLINKYKSMKEFIDILSNDPTALDNIYITCKDGNKKKKLSKNVISNIYKYLLHTNENVLNNDDIINIDI